MRLNLHPAAVDRDLRSTVPPESTIGHEIVGRRDRAVLISMPWTRARFRPPGTRADATAPAQRSTDRRAA